MIPAFIVWCKVQAYTYIYRLAPCTGKIFYLFNTQKESCSFEPGKLSRHNGVISRQINILEIVTKSLRYDFSSLESICVSNTYSHKVKIPSGSLEKSSSYLI